MTDDEQAVAAALVLADRVVQRVRTHPVGTLAGAAGVGVVLARGIPDSVLRLGASLALRAAAARVIEHIAAPPAADAERPASTGPAPAASDAPIDVATSS